MYGTSSTAHHIFTCNQWFRPCAGGRAATPGYHNNQKCPGYLKRPNLTHIFVIPKIMTPLWSTRLLKFSHFSFYIDAGNGNHRTSVVHNTNHYSFVLSFLNCCALPGRFKGQTKFWKWEGICAWLKKPRKGLNSLLCTHFGHSFRGYPKCQMTWCPSWRTKTVIIFMIVFLMLTGTKLEF